MNGVHEVLLSDQGGKDVGYRQIDYDKVYIIVTYTSVTPD